MLRRTKTSLLSPASSTEQALVRLRAYRAPWWARSAHVQTISASRFSKKPSVCYRRERWESPDGDILAVDHVDDAYYHDANTASHLPQLVMFHGLEGSSQSHYSLAIMHEAARRGWRACVVHFRGCGGLANKKPRAYHSGDTAEIDWILRRLKGHGEALLFAVGISLGGNALLKWLGEQGDDACKLVDAAAAICPPQDLRASAYALARGMNFIYMRYFLDSLIPNALERLERFPGLYDRDAVIRSRTFMDFDELVTAPLHGFKHAEHYWASSSCGPWLTAIRARCLVINPVNDPFIPASSLHRGENLHPNVQLAYPQDGGHVGFVRGGWPVTIDWLPEILCDWLGACIDG